MGRKCAVPDCYTGYRNTKEKAPLYRVPDDNILLTKWQEAIARADRLITPNDFVCAKHFRNDDLLKQRIIKDVVETYQRPRLRPDAIPSIFPDPPESIHGMVRKRRKLSAYESMKEQNKNNVNEKTDSDTNITENITDQEVEKVSEKATEPASLSTITSEIIIKEEIELPTESEVPRKYPIVNSNGEYCCDQCSYKTKWQTNLITHKVVHSTVYLRCEICPRYSTKWKSVMKNHMKTKHSLHKEIYICGICRFESVSKEYMKKHKTNHSKQGGAVQVDSTEVGKCEKYFRCTICSFQEASELVMLSHIETVHRGFARKGDGTNKDTGSSCENKRYFPCVACSYKGTSEMDMQNHFDFVHKNIVKEETPCQGANDSNYFPCLYCSFIGKSKSDTLNHFNAFHRDVTVKKEAVCESENDGHVNSYKKSGNDQNVQQEVSDSNYYLDSPDNHAVYIKTEIEES